jgi:DNA-binding transcriptional ArsR family regulator
VHESKTVGQLTESFGGVAQSTISEHLRHLKDAGLISGTRVQNSIRYSLNRPIWDHVRWVLSNVCNDTEFTVFYR